MYQPYEILREVKNEQKLKISFSHQDKDFYLRPVGSSDEEVFKIACWREKYFDAFPGKFYVTFAGTKRWLDSQVQNLDDRFLFTINHEDEILGHLGFYRFDQEKNGCEIDNVVKGTDAYKGLMTKALDEVIEFAFNKLELNYLSLRVFSDNEQAIKLYERCNFTRHKMIPLKKEVTGEATYNWIEVDDKDKAERFFLEMMLKNSK